MASETHASASILETHSMALRLATVAIGLFKDALANAENSVVFFSLFVLQHPMHTIEALVPRRISFLFKAFPNTSVLQVEQALVGVSSTWLL